MNLFEKVISYIEDLISSLLLISGISIIFYGVIMRYVIDNPQTWVDDTSRYLVIWAMLIGATVALRKDEHIKVDFLYDALGRKGKLFLDILSNTIGMGFFAFIFYYSIPLILKAKANHQIVIGIQFPVWIIYLILPIMSGMMILRFILKIAEAIKAQRTVS